MKKIKTRQIITAITVAILLPIALAMGAEEVYGFLSSSSLSSLSSLIFYNVKNEETSLNVEKKVTQADPDVKIPDEYKDTEFEFQLFLNGQLYGNEEYEVYEGSKRVYMYEKDGKTYETTVKDPDRDEILRTTDRNGRFTLKAGQTARFPGLNPGDSYEVIEATQTPFEIVYPAPDADSDGQSGTIAGTLTDSLQTASFTNMYSVGKKGTLQIRKNIAFPENYEVPQTPDFKFEVKVRGKKYANQEYKVMSTASNGLIEMGETDDDGVLTLQGNTYALFEDVPVGDYEVKEILDTQQQQEGWHTIGSSTQEGAISDSGGTVLTFTNTQASFAVTKESTNGLYGDEEFEFQLTDRAGRLPLGTVAYYLYDSNYTLVQEEPLVTDFEGKFKMKAGQKVVFIGIEVGTEYGIKEVNTGTMVQVVPSSGGYIDKEVEEMPEILPFVNSVTEELTDLTVRKTVVNQANVQSVPNVEFTFRITHKVTKEPEEPGAEPEEAYVPLANEPYDVEYASGTGTYETDEDGVFKLHAGETAQFLMLQKGETYRVEEIDVPAGFTVSGDAVKEETIQGEGHEKIEIENQYTGRAFPFTGGDGIAMYIALGLTLIALGGVLVMVKRRRDAKRAA